jgi:hypothetical protein
VITPAAKHIVLATMPHMHSFQDTKFANKLTVLIPWCTLGLNLAPHHATCSKTYILRIVVSQGTLTDVLNHETTYLKPISSTPA